MAMNNTENLFLDFLFFDQDQYKEEERLVGYLCPQDTLTYPQQGTNQDVLDPQISTTNEQKLPSSEDCKQGGEAERKSSDVSIDWEAPTVVDNEEFSELFSEADWINFCQGIQEMQSCPNKQSDSSVGIPLTHSMNLGPQVPNLSSFLTQLTTMQDNLLPNLKPRSVNSQRKKSQRVKRQISAGENFIFDLSQFKSSPLEGFNIYCNEKTEIRNLRVIQVPKTPLWEALPEFTYLSSLESFRQRNSFTLDDCKRDPNRIQDALYFEDEVEEPKNGFLYTPKIRRVYNVNENGESKLICEGLCPYCPFIKFGQLKNSNYGHHLSIQHGVQTNGGGIPSPILHCYYYYEKLNKVNWTNNIIEGVLCPVDGCKTICKISAKANSNPNRLLDYLRHYKKFHKAGKLLDAMKKNQQ